jgi:hypothetical protein
MPAELRLPILANALVTSMGQSMARAEALLPHPAAAPRGSKASRGPITTPITPTTGDRFEVMAAGLSPVAFFISQQTNTSRR